MFGWMQGLGGRRLLALLVLTAAEFVVFLDIAIVNVALPEIGRDLDLGEELAWVVNAYQVTFGGVLLLGGRLADLVGRRRMFLIGLALFTAASLGAGLAASGAILIAARLAQGLGAALVVPAALALLVTVFSEAEDYRRAFGVWSAMRSGGASLGGALGGILTQALGWPWIFLINVPVGVAVLVLGLAVLPERRTPAAARLDIIGAATVTAGALLIVYGIVRLAERGTGSGGAVAALVAAALLLAVFVRHEARAEAPLVPLGIFRSGDLQGATLASLLFGAAHVPMFLFISLYLQLVLGYSALATGLALLPIGIVVIGASLLIMPRVLARFGVKRLLIGGLLLLALGIGLLATGPTNSSYVLNVLGPGVIIALGLAGCFGGVTIPAVEAVEPDDAGLASGLVNSVQRIGSGIGVAVLTAVAIAVAGTLDGAPADVAPGIRAAFAGASVFALLGAACAFVLLRPAAEAMAPETTSSVRTR